MDLRVHPKTFVLTGENILPFAFLSLLPQMNLHRGSEHAANGDETRVIWFKNYDAETDTLSLPAVVEEMEITRDLNGIPTLLKRVYKYYFSDGEICEDTTESTGYISVEAGYAMNRAARTYQIDQASMWLYAELLTDDPQNGEAQAKVLLADFLTAMELFRQGDSVQLQTEINESTSIYLTQSRKANLLSILNLT